MEVEELVVVGWLVVRLAPPRLVLRLQLLAQRWSRDLAQLP